MIIYGIAAMVLVGVSWTAYGYVMGKAPRQDIKIPYLMIVSALFAFTISGAIGLFQGFPRLSAFGYFITFGVLIIYGIANYFQLDLMSLAMQRGPNGIIWSIIQSGFVFPFFMGVIFFGVELNLLRISGLIAQLLSLVFFGTGENKDSGDNWKLLTFNAFLMTGITQMLSNLPSYYPEAEAVSSIWRTAAFSAGIGIGALSVELVRKKPVMKELSAHFRRIAVWKTVLLLEIPEMVSSWILLFPGLDILSKAGIGSIAYPIMVASCIIFFELFAILILKEKRTMLQRVALLLCLLGVIGICM